MNTKLFAEAHQAKASHRINEGFFRKAQQAKASRFFTSPWSVGLRQISYILWSKKISAALRLCV